jgi:hypothetical protein
MLESFTIRKQELVHSESKSMSNCLGFRVSGASMIFCKNLQLCFNTEPWHLTAACSNSLTHSTSASPFWNFGSDVCYCAKTDKTFWKIRWLIWTTFLQIFSHPHFRFWENVCRWCRLLKSGSEWVKDRFFEQNSENGFSPKWIERLLKNFPLKGSDNLKLFGQSVLKATLY